MEKMCEILEF